MLTEEAWDIKKHLNNDEFLTVTAYNGWLEKWKILYGIREKIVNGEAGEVSEETVNVLMERLGELTKDYDPVDIWDHGRDGLLFQSTPRERFGRKEELSQMW